MSESICNLQPLSVKEKLKWFALYGVAYFVFYSCPNLLFNLNPKTLVLTDFELSIPIIPFTFIIYISDYLMGILAVIVLTRRKDFYHYVRMMFMVVSFCGVFFYLFPTTYPRPDYPIDVNSIERLAMWIVSSADSPNNCFPSHHVAATWAISWALRRRSTLYFIIGIVWSLAVVVSTLTTKQHYLVDILGGGFIAILVILLEEKFSKHENH